MGVFHLGFSFPYIVAPIAIPLFNELGFQVMCIVVASVVCVCSPLFICFRKHTGNEDDELNDLLPDKSPSMGKNN